MDSLGAASGRYKLGEPLRHFLSKEWESKKKVEPKVFTKTVMPDYYVSVPCQTNSSDCGLFVLQYVESFLNVS
jgi:sentrin-specific protease 7